MFYFIGLLVLLNAFLAEGAQIFSYHSQDCGSDLSGNIQMDVNTCYGMTGGNQNSMLVLNESDDYTVYVWYGNMQCHDAANAQFNHNTCCNLEDDEFSVMVLRGDASLANTKSVKNVQVNDFF